MFQFNLGDDKDVIKDLKGADKLALDASLWTGDLTRKKVVTQFGTDLGDDVRLNFGGGDSILLEGLDTRCHEATIT